MDAFKKEELEKNAWRMMGGLVYDFQAEWPKAACAWARHLSADSRYESRFTLFINGKPIPIGIPHYLRTHVYIRGDCWSLTSLCRVLAIEAGLVGEV